MIDKLTFNTFSDILHTNFSVALNHPEFPEPLILVLDQVISNGERTETEIKGEKHQNTLRDETFSIVFKGPLDPQLLQGMVNLQHEKLGVIEGLFIVPIKQDQEGVYYEAVFN